MLNFLKQNSWLIWVITIGWFFYDFQIDQLSYWLMIVGAIALVDWKTYKKKG